MILTEKYVKGKILELVRYAARISNESGTGPEVVGLSPVEYEHLVRDLNQVYFPGEMAREMIINGIKIITTGKTTTTGE